LLNHKNAKFNLGHVIITLALFGLIILSVIPAMFYGGGSSTTIVQRAQGQPEDPFPVPTSNETLTPAQRSAREQLFVFLAFR
jgi:hypothetical protein